MTFAQDGAVGTDMCANSAMASWSPSVLPVFTGTGCRTTNHAVVIVGYNADYVTPYWIIRNSWGPNWGANGYLYIKWGLSAVGTAVNVIPFSGFFSTLNNTEATPGISYIKPGVFSSALSVHFLSFFFFW